MLIIHDSVKKNAALAMNYNLRKFLISSFKANIVPINKIAIWEVNNRTQLKAATCTTNKRVDFW